MKCKKDQSDNEELVPARTLARRLLLFLSRKRFYSMGNKVWFGLDQRNGVSVAGFAVFCAARLSFFRRLALWLLFMPNLG
jgi:hypothetical protein